MCAWEGVPVSFINGLNGRIPRHHMRPNASSSSESMKTFAEGQQRIFTRFIHIQQPSDETF